jgi:hypothetical protein
MLGAVMRTAVPAQQREALMERYLRKGNARLPRLLRALCPKLARQEAEARAANEIDPSWEAEIEVKAVAACLVRTLAGKVVDLFSRAASAFRGLKEGWTVDRIELVDLL